MRETLERPCPLHYAGSPFLEEPRVPAELRVKTPCIGVCSTGIGDNVCRGCKRFAHEVIHWNSFSEEQKRIIDERLDTFLSQVVLNKFRICSAERLRLQCEAQQIRFPAHKAPAIWVWHLLRAGAGQIEDLALYGLELDAQFRGTPLPELKQMIDREFYLLSEAHYERYILNARA